MKNKKLLLLCVGLLMTTQMIFSQVPSYVPTNGLVGYWPFNGNANDQSGNGNNGTVNGATLTTDRFGNTNSAYSFDGTNSKIVVPNSTSLAIQNKITLSAWVNCQTSISNGTIISKGEESQYWNYGMGIYNSKPQYNYTNYGVGVNKILNPSEWYNIVITIDSINNQMNFYVNGILYNPLYNFSNNTITTSFANLLNSCCNSSLTFGRNNGGTGGAAFNGIIDDIGIWNSALTQQEITNLYNANQCINTITVTDTLIINVGQLSFTNPVTYANNITIYPNPANTQVNISFNNISDLTGGTIKIMNSLGQQVATTPITATGTNTTMALNSWGGTGLYFVQIVNAQGQIVDIKKIILQ